MIEDKHIFTLRTAEKSSDREIKLIVDFLEGRIDQLPEELSMQPEELPKDQKDEPHSPVKKFQLPPERSPETQGTNEDQVTDPEKIIDELVTKEPNLQVAPPALVHAESPLSPTDMQALRFLQGGSIKPVIATEIWVDPKTKEAYKSVRGINTETNNIASIQRLGTKPIPFNDTEFPSD